MRDKFKLFKNGVIIIDDEIIEHTFELKSEKLLKDFRSMVIANPYLLHNRFLKEFNEKVEEYFNGKY